LKKLARYWEGEEERRGEGERGGRWVTSRTPPGVDQLCPWLIQADGMTTKRPPSSGHTIIKIYSWILCFIACWFARGGDYYTPRAWRKRLSSEPPLPRVWGEDSTFLRVDPDDIDPIHYPQWRGREKMEEEP
jgi:hypothetical protein